jgi:UDP-4-amino-4,6-dideoxy-N-acetyl-beta-L-altrosamine transaminase
MIPYGRHDISQADIDAVVEVLQSDFLTQGPTLPRFEEAVSRYCGVDHAVAVNSATSALHISCVALDLGLGDWLWTSPNTFVASANCALYCGAKVDFVDIDPRTYNLCPHKLEEKLVQAEKADKLPKVVVPVHFAGQPCDMQAIYDLSQKFGFKIIEDASHAIGASYESSQEGATQHVKVGSCIHSDITVFSFHPVKIITSAEGGLATTNDETLAKRIQRLRTHGITTDSLLMKARPDDEIWNYQQVELGFNYRMTDMQAALGLSQLARLDEFVSKRHEIASIYDRAFDGSRVIAPWQLPGTYSSYHLYPVRNRKTYSGKSQRQVYDALRDNGVGANLHYIPVHRHPFYEGLGFKLGDHPVAEQFHREVISLPMYPNLQEAAQNKVIEIARELTDE